MGGDQANYPQHSGTLHSALELTGCSLAPCVNACERANAHASTCWHVSLSCPWAMACHPPGHTVPCWHACLQLAGNGKVRLPAKADGSGVPDAKGGYGFEFDAAYKVDNDAISKQVCSCSGRWPHIFNTPCLSLGGRAALAMKRCCS